MKKEKMLIVLTNAKSPVGYVVCNNSTKCVCSVKLQSRVFGIAIFRAQTDFVRIINGEKSFDFEFDCNTLANLEIFIVTETETFYGASGRKIPQITISEVRNKYAFEKKNELDAKNENHSSQTVVYDDQKTHKSTTTNVAESQLVEKPKVPLVQEQPVANTEDIDNISQSQESTFKPDSENVISAQKEEVVDQSYHDETIAQEDFYPSNIVCITDDRGNKTIDLVCFASQSKNENESLILTDFDATVSQNRENIEDSVSATKSKIQSDFSPFDVFVPPVIGFANTDTTLSESAQTCAQDSLLRKMEQSKKDSVFEQLHARKAGFYERVSSSIDALMTQFAHEKELESRMPDTKWVRINYDKANYYIVGIIGNVDCPEFICYGLPAKFSAYPPEEITRYAKWLPLDVTKPQQDGYWLIFQSAKTGETLDAL